MSLTKDEITELAEAVHYSRNCAQRAAMDVVLPAVERIVARRQDRARSALLLLRDYGRLMIFHASEGGAS